MYIRVVSNIHRWDGTVNLNRPDAKVCGDAITDLKTSNNMLSVWNVDGEEQINESVAVIALGRERLDKVSYVILENNVIENEINLSFQNNAGKCKPITKEEILKRHRDIVELDSAQLENLAAYMLNRVQEEQNATKDEEDIKKIVAKMVDEKKVDPSKIKEKLRKELGF